MLKISEIIKNIIFMNCNKKITFIIKFIKGVFELLIIFIAYENNK